MLLRSSPIDEEVTRMVIHVQAIKNLNPDDYIQIEDEHLRIQKYVTDLRNTCSNLTNNLECPSCSREKWGSCRGLLPSFFYDLIALIGRHFSNEESIMLSRPHVTEDYEYFREHRKAHYDIMHQLQEIIGESNSLGSQGSTADSYRHLHSRILLLFEEHDSTFDDPFIQSTLT
jgi:hypothetical protein